MRLTRVSCSWNGDLKVLQLRATREVQLSTQAPSLSCPCSAIREPNFSHTWSFLHETGKMHWLHWVRLRGPMITPQDIKILHLPLAWWRRDELCLGRLEIKLFQAYNIYCSPWGWLRTWATRFWWNGTGEDSRASTSALYLWVSSEKLYWIHILHPSLWRIQLTFTMFLFFCFQ